MKGKIEDCNRGKTKFRINNALEGDVPACKYTYLWQPRGIPQIYLYYKHTEIVSGGVLLV